MIFIIAVAIVVGFALGRALQLDVESQSIGYLGVGILAGFDSIIGGIRAMLENRFRPVVFLSGLVVSLGLAALLVWLGENIAFSLYSAIGLVFAWRMFTNVSVARRILLAKWRDSRLPKRQESKEAESLRQAG